MRKIIRRLVLLTCCWLNVLYCSAQFRIKGKCLDEKGLPITGINVTITESLDSNRIAKGTITNYIGDFSCDNMSKGSYILRLSIIGYQTQKSDFSINKDADLGTFTLKEDVELLNEVVVTANMLKSYGNKDEIFLRKENLKIGTNALDAISSLPQFKKNIFSNELETADRKNILILIDGKKSSAKELSTLQPDDVKKLNFYSEPPARYAHEKIGAVLEVITKRKKEKQYSLYLDTKNSFTTGYGTNLANIMYSDSLNKLSASYFIDYRALNKNLMNNIYQYENTGNFYNGVQGNYNGQYHIGQLTYQRYQGNNLFNAKLEYRKSPGKEIHQQNVLSDAEEKSLTGSSSKNLKSDNESYSLDLFYMKPFTETRSLSINAVNTFYTSSSDNRLSRAMSNQSSMDYTYENRLNNNSYSLITEALYSAKLWKGDWNIGAYFQYKDLNQTFDGKDKSYLNFRKGYIYTDYSNKWGQLSYTLGLGADNTVYHITGTDSYNYFVMRPSISLNYQLNMIFSFRLNSSIQSQIPDIGYLTNSIVSIDEHFYSKGNTNLKPYHYYSNELKIQYTSEDNKLYFTPTFFSKYYVHLNAPILLRKKGNIFSQYAKLDNMSEMGYSIVGSWSPTQWSTIQSFYQYSYLNYQTPNSQIRHSLHNAGISLQFEVKEIQLMWCGNLPFTSVDGDIYNKVGGNMFMSALWKHKSYSLGAEWLYNPYPSKIYAEIDGFHYMEETVWNNFKSLINFKFTYYLSKGQTKKHLDKTIINSDSDSGLTKFNTAK